MKNTEALTLVELIVVITILAILGIIAFFSFQGYSESSRDSVRISDLSKITSSLEIFSIDAGKYPSPTNSKFITYSGGIIWEQGSFGKFTFSNVKSLNKIPTDPLVDKEYTYSVTTNKNQFQLGSISESDNLANINLINESYAGNASTNALIVGNYNGFAAKSLSGNTCYILSVPTIIANDIETSTDYDEIVKEKKLVFNGFENLPSTFKNTKFKINGGFDFIPNNLIIYSDNDSCKILETDELARIDYLKNIQESYSGTILKDTQTYSKFLGLDINEGTLDNNANIKGLAGNIWHIILGKKVKTTFSMDSLDSMMGMCNIDGKTIDNGESLITYSENLIDTLAAYDCQSITQERTCENGTLSGEEIYQYSSCIKGVATNCSAISNYIYNTHSYNTPDINHSEDLNNLEGIDYLESLPVSENNGDYIYQINNIGCNDGVLVNIQENITPTLVSCDYGYIPDGETCVSEGTVDITSTGSVVCPYCAP